MTHPCIPSQEGNIGIYLLIFLCLQSKNSKMITANPLPGGA